MAVSVVSGALHNKTYSSIKNEIIIIVCTFSDFQLVGRSTASDANDDEYEKRESEDGSQSDNNIKIDGLGERRRADSSHCDFFRRRFLSVAACSDRKNADGVELVDGEIFNPCTARFGRIRRLDFGVATHLIDNLIHIRYYMKFLRSEFLPYRISGYNAVGLIRGLPRNGNDPFAFSRLYVDIHRGTGS